MYRMAGLGATGTDLSQWWVKHAFWSKWAGPPPCPSGSVMTPADCQYKGVFAEDVPPGEHESHAQPLLLWLAERCKAGDYVSLSVPYFDPGLGKKVIAVFAGPGAPDKFRARPRHAPTLTTYGGCPAGGSGCPDGMVEMPGGGCQMPAPPAKPGDGRGELAGTGRSWAIGALAAGALVGVGLYAYSRRAR